MSELAQDDPRGTYVYFMQAENGGPIKIGRAKDPERRLRGMQVGSPVRLVLRRKIWTHPSTETWLHHRFASDRLHGEWYRPTETIATIADAKADDEDHGPVVERRPRGIIRSTRGVTDLERYREVRSAERAYYKDRAARGVASLGPSPRRRA